MKPQTKRQHEIVRLSETLPQLTAKQRTYAFAHCFPHYGVQRAGGKVICTECGHAWREKPSRKRTAICPHCGQKLTLHQTKKRKLTGRDYFCIITTCKGYQVMRYFLVTATFTIGNRAQYGICEVVQHWMNCQGKVETMSMLRPMGAWYTDAWSFSSFELRKNSENRAYMVFPEAVYPHKRCLPQIKRNGFDGKLHDMHPTKYFQSLLTDTTTETLLKAKQYSLMQRHVYGGYIKERYWASVKICMRNGYIVPDASMWCDMIDLLRYFDKDVHNAKYVCPANLQAEHDRLVRMRNEQWERERQELEQARVRERIRKAKNYEKIYRKDKRKFFGLLITDGVINIRVLESVAAFEAEGKAMHHCVFTNNYYANKDALILSATIDDKRIETIEVSLQTFEVVQSRGVCNQDTEYHDRILKLMRDNAYLIQDRMKLAA